MGSGNNERDTDESGTGIDERPDRDGWNETERPSTTIREAVAAATGRAPRLLPPLDRHVDIEALESFLVSGTGPSDGCLTVSFDYEGVEVTVDTDGGIDVRTTATDPADSPTGPTTEAELHTMLRELLQTAFRNGLSVQGGWDARNGSTYPDWDVVVTRVAKPDGVNSLGRS